jgi:FdrA protein
VTSSDRPWSPSWLPDAAPQPARTLDEALERAPEATLAIVGAPRAVAAVEVRRALERGLDVLVAGEGLAPDEAAVEASFAVARGRLLLADDAAIDGVALRGALVAPQRGGIGVVAADRAGALEASLAIERAGHGASHVLVVGGEDVARPSGGAAAQAAIARLGRDPATSAIVLVGASDARALRGLRHAAVATAKPAVVCGVDGDAQRGMGWERIGALADLPRALTRLGVEPTVDERARRAPPGLVLGAVSAPTAAHEVLGVLLGAGLDVASNVPRPGVLPEDVGGHTVRAVAAAEARAAWLVAAASTARPACLVVDMPATPLADRGAAPILDALRASVASAAAARRALRVIVARPRLGGVATGPVDDALRALGAVVVDGAAHAARAALAGAEPALTAPLAGRGLSVITLADDEAAAALAARGVPVLATAWTAPGGGDPRLARLVGLLR